MKKISIIGISATGKSSLARQLQKIINVPIFHCDTFRWSENWIENDEKHVITEMQKVLKNDEWILEGYIFPLSQERLQKSDTIIYLDYSRFEAIFGYIKRYFQHSIIKREELPKGCTDTLTFTTFKNIFLRAERKEIEEEVLGFKDKVVRIKSRKDLSFFLKELADNT